jgi:tetratricopeptide (TPR) repeat protein
MLAGERAAVRFANEEAVTYFEQAALQLGTLHQVDPLLRWRLAAGLGDVYRSMGRYADSTTALDAGLPLLSAHTLSDHLAASLYRRLGETAQKQGDLDTSELHFSRALDILKDPTTAEEEIETAHIMTGLSWTHFLQGRLEQARQACETGLMFARRASALTELAAAENILGGVYYRQGDWAAAMHHTRRAMVLREQMGYTWGVAATLSNLGILAVSAGDWNKARSFFERALALRQEVGDVEGVAIVHNNLGLLARDQGDLERAGFHFRASLAVAQPFQMAFHIGNSGLGLAKVLLLNGEIAAAQEAINDSLLQAEDIGADDLRAEVYCIQAEIMLARGDLDQARVTAANAAKTAAETGNRSLESVAWRVVSEIELERGDTQSAHQALLKAATVKGAAADDLEAGRRAAQRGRIYLFEGQYKQAEADLRKARMIFMRLGANHDLQLVELALKQSRIGQPASQLSSASI